MHNLSSFLISQLGIDCYIYDSVSSTNNHIWNLIDNGVNLPLIVIATTQTQGKGQRNHYWRSPKGGLYLSVGLSVNLPICAGVHFTLLTAWGIANNLQNYDISVKIKWLNDLILNNKKLGGILTETRVKNNTISKVVIGVGINWENNTPVMGINLKSVLNSQNNFKINCLEELALITIQGILNGYNFYLEKGENNLVMAYEKLLINMNQKISFNQQSGIIKGITTQGELKVKLISPGASSNILLPPNSISLGYVN